MADQNGALRQAIRLPDLSPETISIVVDRDGEAVTLSAYVMGKRCPIPVTIAQSAAYQEWEPTRNDTSLTDIEKRAAFLFYVRASLKAVVPGFKDAELDVIAADSEIREELLYATRVWVKSEDAPPEVTGEKPASSPTTAG